MRASPKPRNVQVAGLFVSLLLVGLVAGIGGLATARSVEEWYPELDKPPLTPPGWVFGPAWTILYLLMAAAAWLVWRATTWEQARPAITIYGAQLILNTLWSVAFFGARSPLTGLIVILALIAFIGWTILRFRRIEPLAAWLLIPYLAWVCFATYLNAGIWFLSN